MKLTWWTDTDMYADDAVISVISDGSDTLFFTADYGPTHHKYLITGNVLKRYELTSDFFRVVLIRNWRITA